MKLLQAWIEIHHEELIADWHLASAGEALFKIEPHRQEANGMNPRVSSVHANNDHTLTLLFVNGERRTFDVSPILAKVFLGT